MTNATKSVTSFQIAHHVDRLSILFQSGDAVGANRYYQGQPEYIKASLLPWYAYQQEQRQQFTAEDLPEECCLSLQGWQKFYRHEYLDAHRIFLQASAIKDWQVYALDIALGFAKVYTRTGHWFAARAWCLYYLQLARKQSHNFAIAKGYGALAEIFLRSSHAKEALACFQMAYHLMPLRNHQKSRQYNFMASALMRHEEWLRAEALLNTSRQLGINLLQQKDWVSQQKDEALISLMHSEMRMAFLCFLQDNQLTFTSRQAIFSDANPVNPQQLMPTAMYWVAQGLGEIKHNENLNAASDCFNKARQLLQDSAPIEYAWVAKLCHFSGNCLDVVIDESKLREIFALQPCWPPDIEIVCDKIWSYPKLIESDSGFSDLLSENLSDDALINFWRKLFI